MRRLARSARTFLPAQLSMAQLRESAAGCTGCDLYKCATQTVFGEGAGRASMMFVGEQPGDQEDLAGRPFVFFHEFGVNLIRGRSYNLARLERESRE